MTLIVLLLSIALVFSEAEENTVNELFSLMGTPSEKTHAAGVTDLSELPLNQSRAGGKDPSLPVNELLEQIVKAGESKYALQPLPAGVWPKHSDLMPLPRLGHHNKSKKATKSEKLPPEYNSEKNWSGFHTQAPNLLLKTSPVNRTHKTAPDPPSNTPALNDPDVRHNFRPRSPLQPAVGSRRDPSNRRLDPEENRPGKSSLYQSGGRNSSRPSVMFNRRSSSLLYHFDVLKKESELTQEAVCLSECSKEKEENDHYCYSEFAVNGIVHDIETIRRGIRLVALLVSSDGFYKMSRLYVTPDSFFFKVRLLVLDTYKCTRPCPELKLGSRYIIMGQIYHRRRHLPKDLLALLGGRLKPGDGLLRSNNYVKRFNKRRHQKAQEASRSRCR